MSTSITEQGKFTPAPPSTLRVPHLRQAGTLLTKIITHHNK